MIQYKEGIIMIKKRFGGLFVAVSFILGVPAGMIGAIAVKTAINKKRKI